jgi:hypothetical protein
MLMFDFSEAPPQELNPSAIAATTEITATVMNWDFAGRPTLHKDIRDTTGELMIFTSSPSKEGIQSELVLQYATILTDV